MNPVGCLFILLMIAFAVQTVEMLSNCDHRVLAGRITPESHCCLQLYIQRSTHLIFFTNQFHIYTKDHLIDCFKYKGNTFLSSFCPYPYYPFKILRLDCSSIPKIVIQLTCKEHKAAQDTVFPFAIPSLSQAYSFIPDSLSNCVLSGFYLCQAQLQLSISNSFSQSTDTHLVLCLALCQTLNLPARAKLHILYFLEFIVQLGKQTLNWKPHEHESIQSQNEMS